MSPGPAFLAAEGLRLVLFGGKGGVGKTTCAAATALARARRAPDARVLLVSTDPAHSLADVLAEVLLPSNLTLLELDAEASLSRWKEEHGARLREIAARGTFLTDAEIDRFLGLSLPGLDELMAFVEMVSWVEAGTYGLVVVDTAPTGHTLRLLQTPRFVAEWLRTLDALLAKHRYLRRVFSGTPGRDELDAFLAELATSVSRTAALLSDADRCRFVPVLLGERLSTLETRDLLGALERTCIPAPEAVVNRIRPASACPACSRTRERQQAELVGLFSERPEVAWWGLPLAAAEVRGAALDTLLEALEPLACSPAPAPPGSPDAPRVEAPLALPPLSLLVFAGKGGVGKTTVAVAAALRLAELDLEAATLLVSTDPAHSVADALDRPIGPGPVRVAGGLYASEVDPAEGFARFRSTYEDEVASLLAGVLRGFDLAYDRQVLERMLDLSPPGLDELMAVSSLADALGSRRFARVVIDPAPTGHLVRLLETPALVEGWVRAFVQLLQEYRTILRLPRTMRALVTFARSLRGLRSLLADPARSAVLAVASPAELAFSETSDLLDACRRLGIAVRGLVLNLVPGDGGPCPLCSARARAGAAVRDRFAAAFPALPRGEVREEGDPRGVPALLSLGRRLFPEVARA